MASISYKCVLQFVAVRCSVLQCVAVRCSALQCVALRCSALHVLQCVAEQYDVDQWRRYLTSVCCSALHVLQYVAVRCSAL